ncbi:MAG TPA: hypothetical protein VFB95_03135 [Candidatus Cryosericum sp.]|nr:hypothetical protein [Candidatus Cryosericum sp.]
MKQGGGGLGFVMAIVVLVIVLFLAAKAWNVAMPKAAQAVVPGSSRRVDDHGQTGAGDAVRSGTLPNMKQMGQNTDQHIQQIQDAAGKQD